MFIGYKFRAYPNAEQRIAFAKNFGCCRWIYNWGLAKKVAAWNEKKENISRFDLGAKLPALKKENETSWLGESIAQSLQGALKNLDAAFVKFFREKKGFPKFKSKHNKQSFSFAQGGIVNFDSGTIQVPKIGCVKVVIDRHFIGKVKTVTVSKVPSGKYFISVLVDTGIDAVKPSDYKEESTAGIDMGLKHFCTMSSGEKIENPRHLKWKLRKLAHANRSLSRKKKGSNNRDKQRKKVALIYEKVTNCRKDFQHKLSTRIIRENQAVALETLDIKSMLKNRHLAKHIADAGWAQFVSMLEYKADWYGKTVLRIGQFEPSSKLCSCGVINRSLKLSDRTWKCDSCNTTHDRDVLAAQNIKRMALNPKNFIPSDGREFTLGEIGNSRSLNQELSKA